MMSSTDDETHAFLGSEDDDEGRPTEPKIPASSRRRRQFGLGILALTNLLTALVCGAGAVVMTLRSGRKLCPMPLNQPPEGAVGPLRRLAALGPRPQLMNVSWYTPGDNIYRQPSSPEVDAAWDSYTAGESGYVMLSREDGAQKGLDPSRHVFLDRPDLGLHGYVTQSAGVEQMWCLDQLRRYLPVNLAQTLATCRPPWCNLEGQPLRLRLERCVEVIRLRLQCTTDLGLVPTLWMGWEGMMTADHANWATCADWEALRRFSVEETVEIPYGAVRPAPGDFVLDDHM